MLKEKLQRKHITYRKRINIYIGEILITFTIL